MVIQFFIPETRKPLVLYNFSISFYSSIVLKLLSIVTHLLRSFKQLTFLAKAKFSNKEKKNFFHLVFLNPALCICFLKLTLNKFVCWANTTINSNHTLKQSDKLLSKCCLSTGTLCNISINHIHEEQMTSAI